ncbi:MAG: histidine phosphatase family protein [Actinomycetes bacterium]
MNARGASLFVVRHGQSTWNAAGRWQGRADPALTELGEQHAADAARHVGAIDEIWTSNLERARRTAEIVADHLGLAVRVDARLAERDAGEWEGLTRDEIEAGWPGWLAEHRRPPGFEPDDVVAARGVEVLTELAGRSGRLLVVSHSGVIRAVERALAVSAGQLSNLGGVEFHLDAGGRLAVGDRVVLLDPSEVEITTPKQI